MHLELGRQLKGDPWFAVGLGLALVFGLAALLGPTWAPFDPQEMSFRPLAPPSAEHLLGVNDGGQDIFSELLTAVRNTVAFGLVSGLAALIVGVVLGLTAAWFGGLVDHLLMRLAEVVLAVPAVMVLILTAALFRPPPPAAGPGTSSAAI